MTSATDPAKTPYVAEFRDVSKTFAGTPALQQVSFAIKRGAVQCLLGGNGSGKSTLIKILAGVYHADAGEVIIDGVTHSAARTNPAWAADCGLHFVHQAVGTFPNLTVAENFALGSAFPGRLLAPIPWRRLNREVQGVLDRFELDVRPTTKMGDLRPATRTMVAVARALRSEDAVGRGLLVLDEPTASLPPHEAESVLDAIRGYAARGQTVIFVTHRLGEALAVSTDITFLRDGIHLETRTAAGLKESDLVSRIAQIAVPPTDVASGIDRPATRVRLELADYSAGPIHNCALQVRSGEIVGISGLLGSGRTSLLQSLFGSRGKASGSVRLDGEPFDVRSPSAAMRRGVAYVPEDRGGQAGFAELSMRANLAIADLPRYRVAMRMKRSAEVEHADNVADGYGVVVSSSEAPFSSMSGGNQQKVILARWLERKPRLLLLDEPTQGVDVGARAAIHATIKRAARAGTAVLVVSSDPQELSELCDRVVGLRSGQISGEVIGAAVTPHRCIELANGLVAEDTGASSTLGQEIAG